MALYILLDLLEDDEEFTERRRNLKSLRDDSDPFSLNDAIFRANFRLTKEICHSLINELINYDEQPTSLPFSARFFCCIYFFSHGSYQKCVGNGYVQPMSQASVSRSINYIATLIAKHKSNEIMFPTSNDAQIKLKAGFNSKFGIKGTIGAIDCTHIPLVCPPQNDPTKPCSMYMNRKGYYSINVEAVCDDNLNILALNAKFPGSCHDSGIWTTSAVRAFMCTTRQIWLLGDQGYPLEPWLMTPLASPQNPREEKFNKIHCKARNTIERCFGVLKSRFRCLSKHRVLHYKPEVATCIINACAILHNIINKKCAGEELNDIEENDIEENDIEEYEEATLERTQNNLHREGEQIRRSIINTL